MTKKIIAIAAVLLVLLVAVPMVFAEDQNSSDINKLDTDTIKEISIMNTGLGAELRLLQLEKSLTRNVLVGAQVVDVISTNHPDANISPAQTTLDELETTMNDVKTLAATPDANGAVQQFVELKKEGTTLTQDFRKETSQYLDANDRQQITTATKNMDTNELQSINDQIQAILRQYNADRIDALLKLMGTSDPALIQGIVDGNITQSEITDALRADYNSLTTEQKAVIDSLLKESVIKRLVGEKALIQRAEDNLGQRLFERQSQMMQRLSDWYQKMGANAQKRDFNARATRLEKVSQELEKISQQFDKWAAQKSPLRGRPIIMPGRLRDRNYPGADNNQPTGDNNSPQGEN